MKRLDLSKQNRERGFKRKFQITDKRFYAASIVNDYFPSGVIRLYRPTYANPAPKGDIAVQSVRIKNPEELSDLKVVLDLLSSSLDWQDLPPMLAKFEEQLKKEAESPAPQTKTVDEEALRLVQQYPKAMTRILRAYSEVFNKKLEPEDFPDISEIIQVALQLIVGREKDMVQTQIALLERLEKEESPEGIRRLIKLMQEHPLFQLTSVTTIITARLNQLGFFEKEIQNEKAYEIRGDNSIHNQLKKALWIIDDNYWLLQSNEPLSNFLNDEFANSTEDEEKRPDFICATSEDRLVIVELKRPSHKIVRADINQLQDYLITAKQFKKYKEKKGYLIGKQISDRDQSFIDEMKDMEFKSYSTVVEDCNRRYKQYLDALKQTDES